MSENQSGACHRGGAQLVLRKTGMGAAFLYGPFLVYIQCDLSVTRRRLEGFSESCLPLLKGEIIHLVLVLT